MAFIKYYLLYWNKCNLCLLNKAYCFFILENAVITMNTLEYEALEGYVNHYRPLFDNCDDLKCPLFPRSLTDRYQQEGCCQIMSVTNISKVIYIFQ